MFLGRALGLKLSAVHQYSTQALLVAAWELIEAAASFGMEAGEQLFEEEQEHHADLEALLERLQQVSQRHCVVINNAQ